MILTPIIPTGHLYSVADVFPESLADRVSTVDWHSADYDRISIGDHKRRQLHYNPQRDSEFDSYVWTTLAPQIQRDCGVEFTDLAQHSFTWWLDEPGFKPRMHTDGDLPAALQVYWQPTDQTDLGTAFYSTDNTTDLTHYFASVPNTGYLMLNSHEPRPLMWHDMQQAVPAGVLRLSLYITFGPYRIC
jgi:hypothetical protein